MCPEKTNVQPSSSIARTVGSIFTTVSALGLVLAVALIFIAEIYLSLARFIAGCMVDLFRNGDGMGRGGRS